MIRYMFSNKDLKKLIVLLFLEQLLAILVGLADTFVISFVGEAAVSGVSLVNSWVFHWNLGLLKRILGIAVPNGVEQGIFQFVKVALSSVVALFGTYQIAANGIAQSIWSLAALVCVTMGPVFITVIGQCNVSRLVYSGSDFLYPF